MKKDGVMLSLDSAAERMQTTELNVLLHIKRGLLTGEEHDGKWFVAETSLDTFLTTEDRLKTEVICKTGGCGGCSSCG